MDIKLALMAFFGVAVLDFLWAKYISAAQGYRRYLAGFYSMWMYYFGSQVVQIYVHDGQYVYPAMLGAFVGTVLAIRPIGGTVDTADSKTAA